MKSQKQAVIDSVKLLLPNIEEYKDNALQALSVDQLEAIKQNITVGITDGDIDYSKDRTNYGEVRSYARSMTMNHLKKAKELNGNVMVTSSPSIGNSSSTKVSVRERMKLAPKNVDPDLLPDELKAFVKSLI